MKLSTVLFILLSFCAVNAHADVANAEKLQKKYEGIGKANDPTYQGASPEEGQKFFNANMVVKEKTVSCSSCHTTNPGNVGKNIVTGKPIKPLSPTVNEKRFNNLDRVEAKFSEHCNDVVGRECTAQEKANFISYLLSVKK